MKTVTMFECEDGSLHYNVEKAKIRDRHIKKAKEIESILSKRHPDRGWVYQDLSEVKKL